MLLATVFLINSCSSDGNGEASIYHKWYYKERIVGESTYPYIYGSCGKDYVEFYDTNKVRQVAIIDCQPVMGSTGTFTKQENAISMTTTYSSGETSIVTGTITALTEHSLTIQYDDITVAPSGQIFNTIIKYER